MRKLTFIVLILLSVNSYCQKDIDIPENKLSERFYEDLDSLTAKYDLKDLRESKDQAIRIWTRNEIILLGENSEYIFHTDIGEKGITKKRNFNKVTNLDSIFQLFKTLNDENAIYDQYQIDEFPIAIELNTSQNYELISFYTNDQLEEIIQIIRKENSINELRKELINKLPPGEYQIGMTSIRVDTFPKGEKSDFYKKIVKEIKTKLNIDEKTDPRKMPMILINNKPNYFEDLNLLTISNILNYEIINDTRKSIYGINGKFGVIIINTN